MVPLAGYLRNTLWLCLVTVCGGVFSSAVVAYGFARLQFRGKDSLFLLMLATLLTQFYRTLPEELSEAARVDGAGEWTIFWRVLLPLAKPALATCALFQFLGTWNDFFGPLLYLNDPSRYTLAYGLQQFLSQHGGQWAQLMAASSLFTLPIIALFFFTQRTFIQGIATTGGKN